MAKNQIAVFSIQFSGFETLIQKFVLPTATTDLSAVPEIKFNYGAGFSIAGKQIKIFENEKDKSKTLMVLGTPKNQQTDSSICFMPLSQLTSIEVINPQKFIHYNLDQIATGLLDALRAVAHDSTGKEALSKYQNVNLIFQGDKLNVQVSSGAIELLVGKKMLASNWSHELVETLNRSLR